MAHLIRLLWMHIKINLLYSKQCWLKLHIIIFNNIVTIWLCVDLWNVVNAVCGRIQCGFVCGKFLMYLESRRCDKYCFHSTSPRANKSPFTWYPMHEHCHFKGSVLSQVSEFDGLSEYCRIREILKSYLAFIVQNNWRLIWFIGNNKPIAKVILIRHYIVDALPRLMCIVQEILYNEYSANVWRWK